MFKYNPQKAITGAKKKISDLTKVDQIQAVAIFDLSGSTNLKAQKGHHLGTKKSLTAILLCRHIVKEFHGSCVKDLGDGILCRFDNPIQACLAALAIKIASFKSGLKIKGAITVGVVDLLSLDSNVLDIYGITVDKCSRILSYSLPCQILLDKSVCDAVKTQLIDYKNIEISSGWKRHLRDIGETELFEISTSEFGLQKYIHTQFRVHEQGRIALSDKVYFVRDACKEVIELGLGMTTFSKWFSGQRPSEFRDYIENLIARGIKLTLLCIDPNWPGAKRYFSDNGEEGYVGDILRSLISLKKEQERLLKMGLSGSFEIYLYRFIPSMHILCVDPEDSLYGRMLISPYLYNKSRSECPVFEFSFLSNQSLFKKYKESLLALIKYKSKLY